MLSLLLCSAVLGLAPAAAPSTPPAAAAATRLEVNFVSDEAEAVLAILDKQRQGARVTEADWKRLWESEGYRRLTQREKSMGRPFEQDDFRRFALSPELVARAPALRETLQRWRQADLQDAAARARAYLPAGTPLRARIYPVIKPRDNSFVFELDSNPAIFLYLDPSASAAQFANTVAHELHHAGSVSGCAKVQDAEPSAEDARRAWRARRWSGGFGEGLAMLAAAGGPDVHPHASSPPEDRARWDRDSARFEEDRREVERFLSGVVEGRFKSDEESRAEGSRFYGTQGPWYTVGYRMAVTVERALGHQAVVDAVCRPELLLESYNRAVGQAPPEKRGALWAPALLQALRRR